MFKISSSCLALAISRRRQIAAMIWRVFMVDPHFFCFAPILAHEMDAHLFWGENFKNKID